MVSVIVDDKEMYIHSNIVSPNDKVKIEYKKNNKIKEIEKIETITETEQVKKKIMANIKNVVTMLKYKDILSKEDNLCYDREYF